MLFLKNKKILLLIFFFVHNPVLFASNCKYQDEFIEADLKCKGNGDCMFSRFQGNTSYEGDLNDYLNCLQWKIEKINNNKSTKKNNKPIFFKKYE